MTPQMIQIILWIPFLFVAVITLPVFCGAGYRRGAWNALVSLAATVIAAVCSVALARLLAQPVSKPIVVALEEALAGRNGGMSMGMEAMVIQGIVCVFMAMGLYFLLMLVLTALFKYIGRALWDEELERTDASMRWGGLGVRLVDGVLYTLLLLLPLYGTLGSIMPMISSMTSLSGVDRELRQTVTAIAEHPVAKVSSAGPLQAVYGQLAVVPTENGDIPIVEVTQSITGTVERYQMLEEAAKSGELTMEQAEDMVDFLRDELLHQQWVYAGYQEMLSAIPPEAYEDELFAELIELVDMDRETFTKNMDTILSVVQYAFEEGVVERLQQNPDQAIEILYDSGLMERMGDMINSSRESVALRDLLIRETVASLCRGDERQASALMATYDSKLHLDTESRLRDTEAMLLITDSVDGDGSLNSYEALLRLGFDQEALREVFVENEGDSLYHYFWTDAEYVEQKLSELKQKYGKELSEQELIWQEVLAASQLPLGEYARFDRNVPDFSENNFDWADTPEFS